MLRVRDCTDRCQIFSTPDKRHAFGMMFRDTAQGGSADEIIGYFWKKLAPYPQDGLGVPDSNCIALFGLRYEPFESGSNPSTTYLFVGDFDTVRNGARALTSAATPSPGNEPPADPSNICAIRSPTHGMSMERDTAFVSPYRTSL
jgi:hypothetical protein